MQRLSDKQLVRDRVVVTGINGNTLKEKGKGLRDYNP